MAKLLHSLAQQNTSEGASGRDNSKSHCMSGAQKERIIQRLVAYIIGRKRELETRATDNVDEFKSDIQHDIVAPSLTTQYHTEISH